jgi:hypothetical protein
MVEQAGIPRIRGRAHESDAAILNRTDNPRDFQPQSRPALIARRNIARWLREHPGNNLALHEIERLMNVTEYG